MNGMGTQEIRIRSIRHSEPRRFALLQPSVLRNSTANQRGFPWHRMFQTTNEHEWTRICAAGAPSRAPRTLAFLFSVFPRGRNRYRNRYRPFPFPIPIPIPTPIGLLFSNTDLTHLRSQQSARPRLSHTSRPYSCSLVSIRG